jgi:hypothetical protein
MSESDVLRSPSVLGARVYLDYQALDFDTVAATLSATPSLLAPARL